jgi:alpha/beta superfamily hydrolase
MKVNPAQKISFPSGSLRLEGMIVRGAESQAVVISHPHPLYGGDLDNYVVGLLARAFEESGWTSLRFNFRGVGRSQGDFDQGEGEQADVAAAVAFLKGQKAETIYLAGYSFGAWVNARAALTLGEVRKSVLVSPPAGMMDFSFLKEDNRTSLIIVGDQDPFCPKEEIKKIIQEMPEPPVLKVIPGADHFYSSGAEDLTAAVRESLRGQGRS